MNEFVGILMFSLQHELFESTLFGFYQHVDTKSSGVLQEINFLGVLEADPPGAFLYHLTLLFHLFKR